MRAVVEVEAAPGDDQRNGDRVAVLGHGLPGLQAQPDHAHRPAVRDLLEPKRARLVACGHLVVNIIHVTGIEGARRATGTVVVIDVLRSFTVSAYALAGGARECRLVRTVAEARSLAARTPGSVLCAEEDALPVEGIPISNSPTAIQDLDMHDRVLVQRSTAGTQAVAVVESSQVFAASLVVASATAMACVSANPETITLVASADHPEDHACARYIEGVIRGERPELEQLLEPLRASERYAHVLAGTWPGFPPTDVELSLAADRFDFAMPVSRGDGYMSLRAQRAANTSSTAS
jgi:2-phosphosulfolactate phosphatase